MSSQETELTFIRCPNCRSLVPAIATRCRMCGHEFEKDIPVKSADRADVSGSRSRVRQKSSSISSDFVEDVRQKLKSDTASEEVRSEATEPPVSRVKQLDNEVSETAEVNFGFSGGKKEKDINFYVNKDQVGKSEKPENATVEEDLSSVPKVDLPFKLNKKAENKVESKAENKKEPLEFKKPKGQEPKREQKQTTKNQSEQKSKPEKMNKSNKSTSSNKRRANNNEPRFKEDKKRVKNKKNNKDKDKGMETGDNINADEKAESFNGKSTSSFSSTEVSKGANGMLIGWLINFSDDSRGVAREVREGQFFVGKQRLRDTDMVFTDESISTPHCLMRADAESGIFIQDLMSEKGTYIKRSNGDTIQVDSEPRLLNHGDWVIFGEYELLISLVPVR